MDNVSLMLRRRYIFALGVIAFLVIMTNIGTQNYIEKQSHDSRVINLAGKQRMLSQKITKEIYAIHFTTKDELKHEIAFNMEADLDLWEKTHIGLQTGDKDLNLPGNNVPEIQSMFDGIQKNHLAILYYADQVKNLVIDHKETDAEMDKLIADVMIQEKLFLAGMDKIVFKYDELAKAKVDSIKKLEKILLILTLSTLIAEAFFIFKPAEDLVNSAIKTLKSNESNMQQLFDIAPSVMFLIDVKDCRIIRLNEKATAAIGIQFDEAIGKLLYEFIEAQYLDVIKTIDNENYFGNVSGTEVTLRNVNNEVIPMLMTVSRLFYQRETILLVGLSDITEQKKSEEILKQLASVDEMTGLLNRRTGLIVFEKSFEYAKRRKTPITACFIDLDGLKMVNDTFGHSEGDVFIKTVSKSILNAIRAEDIAFRYGGDEFVIIFIDCDEDKVESIIARIKSECREFTNRLKQAYVIDFSYGTCTYSQNENIGLDEFIRIADGRMYKNKHSKKA